MQEVNRNELRKDGVTKDMNLEDLERLGSEKDDIEEYIKEEQKVTYPRDDDKDCIDPCPVFDCIANPDNCQHNCERTLENPCLICTENCSDKRKSILLRTDVLNYQKYIGGRKMDVVYKDTIAGRRRELMEKKENLKEEIEFMKKNTKESVIPTKIALMFKINKIKQKRNEIKSIENRLDEQIQMFK